MNTANKLTLTRVFLIPLFLVVLYLDFPYNQLIDLAIFVLASVTDFIDGYIARHYDQVTDFGKFMDPLADKLLVMAALIWFVSAGRFPAWAMLVVVAREFSNGPCLIIADQPTRGIDVGAKKEIYQLINQLKARGKGILMISSEMPEILGMSDRILVLAGGRLKGELRHGEATQEKIMSLIVGEQRDGERA